LGVDPLFLQENYGLDLVEVKDNGAGVSRGNVPFMALPHSTSKISTFGDLCTLETYGFRGEALHSLASMASLSVTTRTEQDALGHTYQFNTRGEMLCSKPAAAERGTTVAARHLFKDFPVRRQCYKSSKHCKEELKRVEDYLLAFGICHPEVYFQLRHNKHSLWQKPVALSLETNMQNILGQSTFKEMAAVNYQCFDPMVKIRAFVPRAHGNIGCVTRSNSDRIFVLANKRPVVMKSLVQVSVR